MDVGREKLRENCDFEVSVATLTREMDVGREKLRENCDCTSPIATLSHEVRSPKTEVKLRFHGSGLCV